MLQKSLGLGYTTNYARYCRAEILHFICLSLESCLYDPVQIHAI